MNTKDPHEYCSGEFSPDDVVISGMSGRFPLCENIGQLYEALITGKDMLEQNNDRFEKGACDLTFGSSGTIGNLDKFDAEFFGIPFKNAHITDPLQRILLEVSYEAMVDSGYDPSSELRGSKIGVYTAITNEDGKHITLDNRMKINYTSGYIRAMYANRCSHTFDFHGPSYTVDSACSSSLVALWSAFIDVRDGRVDAALVNAGQLCLSPVVSLFYVFSGMISPTATTCPFDERADGIVRTEAVTALFIQKAAFARRAYATILDIQNLSNGYVPEGVYVPSLKGETMLFQEVMNACRLTPNDIEYIEAHGTGTVVGDPIEIKALENAYCKERDRPLYIGSIKGNLGHSEASAGHCGVIKAILAFEKGIIPPCYWFKSPNPNCEALINGKIKVVTEPMPLTSPYIPVSCYGFGGSITQAILKKNPIEYYSSDSEHKNLPRLVLFPATTEAAILSMFDYIEEHSELRNEFFALLNKLAYPPTLLKQYRGYSLFQTDHPPTGINNLRGQKKRQIWFVMTGMGCQWSGMGVDMMRFNIFAESMRKSAAVLKPLGIDLFEILRKDGEHLQTDRIITPAFVSIAAIQIALVDMLRALQIEPDGIIGHSVGELLCAYADGCCTAEQTILLAYWRGKCVETSKLVHGAMAAVGLTWEETTKRCPEGVYPACHNSEDSVTISGPKEQVESFVAELQEENIFARVVNAYGYAFHSEYIWPASDALRHVLSEIIRESRKRTDRWISTSYPEEEWGKKDCEMAGAEYFVHNLMSIVNFNNMLKRIPSNAITIEIGPHFLLQSILKRTLGSEASYIGLMKRNNGNNVGFFLESMGKLYVEGVDPKIENIYPPVQFPVPRSTPFISDLIKWDHSQSWLVPKWKQQSGSYEHNFHIGGDDSYLLDHFIDGKSLFPATGYVYLAWQALAKKLHKNLEELNIVIEDFKIHRATIISPTIISFTVSILIWSGSFEILEGNSLVASGKIYEVQSVKFLEPEPTVKEDASFAHVSGEEFYNEIKIHGYEYGQAFRKLIEMHLDGSVGFIEWTDWITFMDSMLLFYIATANRSDFVLPTGALSFQICPSILQRSIVDCRSKGVSGLPVNFYTDTMICRSTGIEIQRLEVDSASRYDKSDTCIFEEYKFIPYFYKYISEDKKQRIEKYMSECNKTIETMEGLLKSDFSFGKFSNEYTENLDAEDSVTNYGEHKILFILKDIVNMIIANRKIQNVQDIYSSFLENFGEDYLNTFLINEYCLRNMFDIIIENNSRKLNVLEIEDSLKPILPAIVGTAETFSMLKYKSKILVCKNEESLDKQIGNNYDIQLLPCDKLFSVASNKSQDVVISSFSIGTKKQAENHIHLLSSTVKENGFILLAHKSFLLPPEILIASLSGESISTVSHELLEEIFYAEGLLIISKISDNLGGFIYLLRHKPISVPKRIINMKENNKWLNDLKKTIEESFEVAWLVSENYPNSGIIGMVNCLRHELGGDRIRCVFIPQQKISGIPPLTLTDPFFEEMFQKDLTMNIHKNGKWGSYRHIQIDKEDEKEVDYSYLKIKKYGDISSLQWYESAIKYSNTSDDTFLHIYYSALNFRDVMLATGKISERTVKAIRGIENHVLGFEVCGRTKNGKRFAGICGSRGMATASYLDLDFQFEVPDNWTMEDAATVPVVYATSYYALIIRGNLQPGQSVLIHSGTGGVGQAAINIALSMNCEIFTTVGTQEKKKYLLKIFPEIKLENIGCSRNISFEHMIMKQTTGRGVDLVLNSLADEKFYASIRCVAKHGKFLEIGKYDLSLDHAIGSKCLLENISIHGVFLDQLLKNSTTASQKDSREIVRLMKEGIKRNVVKPLDRTVFQYHEAEKAFRYMGAGTHTGKVLIKIRDEEEDKKAIPKPLHLPCIPVTYFYPQKVYIVIGGLGGFGIEVSKWLLSKGAKNLVLTSRYGARTPYHHLCLKRWENEGHNVTVSTKNVSVKEEAAALLKGVAQIGPVGGIFNSAVVLHDAMLENVNMETFKEVCAPKADATENLDALSRCLCPELDHFICFSSISCGRGNAGQMNYGYANSVMERICEQRRAEGFPGLAIQWGIIGEVGVVHRHMGDDAMIAGVGAQKVQSCLKILDRACQLQHPVVCSYVTKDSSSKKRDLGNPIQQLAKIFGLKDASDFNPARSFSEMGIDSMLGVEVKNLLETTCDTTFTVKEIQELKIDDVKILIEKAESQKKGDSPYFPLVSTASIKLPKYFIHNKTVDCINTIVKGSPVFVIDLDCNDSTQLQVLGEVINHPAFSLLWSEQTPTCNVELLASWYLEKMKGIRNEDSHIIAFSSASILAFEMMLQSEKSEKHIQTLTIINGSSHLTKAASKEMENTSESDILHEFVEKYIPVAGQKLRDQLAKAPKLEQQIRIVTELFTKLSSEAINKIHLSGVISSYVSKIQQLKSYKIPAKLSKDLVLIEDATHLLANDVAEVKLLLSEVCSGKITIHRVPGISKLSEDGVKKIKTILDSVL